MHPIYSKFKVRITCVTNTCSSIFIGLFNGDIYEVNGDRRFIGNFESPIHKIEFHNDILFVLASSFFAIIKGKRHEIKEGYYNIYCKNKCVICSNSYNLDKYEIGDGIELQKTYRIPRNCKNIWLNPENYPVTIHNDGSFVVYKETDQFTYKEFDYIECFIAGDNYFFILNKGTLYSIDTHNVKQITKLFDVPVQKMYIYDSLYCFVDNFLYKFSKDLKQKILIGWGGDNGVAFYREKMFQAVRNFLIETKIKKHEYL